MAKGMIPRKREWMNQIFEAKKAQDGGVVRRAVADVKKYGSVAELKRRVRENEFHLIRTGDQYVVLCHRGTLKVIC